MQGNEKNQRPLRSPQIQGAPQNAPRRVLGTYASKRFRSNTVDGGLSAAGSKRTNGAKARNDLRYSLYRSLHTYTQSVDYAQALHNRHRPLLDYQEYLPNLPRSPDRNRPKVQFSGETSPAPLAVLARPAYIPFDHTTTVGLPYSLTRHIPICPPTDTEPRVRSDTDLWPTDTGPRMRSDTDLGSTITNPCAIIMAGKIRIMHGKTRK